MTFQRVGRRPAMDLSRLSSVYDAPGPFATAYLDTTRSTENASHEIELRWRAARQELEQQGANATVLDAMEAVVGEDRGVPGPHGRVLVAADDDVVLDLVLPSPPRREIARFAPLPHLMPLVAQAGAFVPHVVVLADRTGAEIRVVGPGAHEDDHEVRGNDFNIRKVKAGGWSQKKYQQSAENTWEKNAKLVAEDVARAVRRTGAAIVAVVGDVRAVTDLRDELPEEVAQLVHVIEEPAQLEERVAELVASYERQRTEQVLDEYQRERGRGDAAVEGLERTVAALQQAQVETLLLVDHPEANGELWIGPEPTLLALDEQELRALGVNEPQRDRVDAAIMRALVGTDAGIVVLSQDNGDRDPLDTVDDDPPGSVPTPVDVAGGIGAVLRYPNRSEARGGERDQ
jgi:Bacterial archaeo-eukaryotic release factor family 2